MIIEYCIILITICICICTYVYINSYRYKETNTLIKPYEDMLKLTNQFADLSAQLYNKNSHVNFPPRIESPPDPVGSAEEELDEMLDLQGGRI